MIWTSHQSSLAPAPLISRVVLEVGSILHLIFASTFRSPAIVICLQLVRDLDVEVTLLLFIGFAGQHSSNLLPFLYSQDFSQVKDGLLPMRVLRVWPCREAYWLVAGRKVDVEPSDKRVHEIVSSDI